MSQLPTCWDFLSCYGSRDGIRTYWGITEVIETLTLITISILLLIYFRPGKTPKLDNPLVINRTGRYQATLASQLNLAQPFIEAIAEQLGSMSDTKQISATHIFEVYDKQVIARSQKFYLLSISQREGMLYFDASSPQHHTRNEHSPLAVDADERIVAVVQEAAKRRGIIVRQIAP